MYMYKCPCGNSIFFFNYTIHLEGTTTFRRYEGKCQKCLKNIDTMDINEEDIKEQEYLC